MTALVVLIAHLEAAKAEIASGDTALIAVHIDVALAAAQRLMTQIAREEV